MKSSLLKEINDINSLDELGEVIDLIKLRQKAMRYQAAQKAKSTLSEGRKVIVSQRNGDLTGVLLKINRTKAIVQLDEYKGRSFVKCDVPLSMITAA